MVWHSEQLGTLPPWLVGQRDRGQLWPYPGVMCDPTGARGHVRPYPPEFYGRVNVFYPYEGSCTTLPHLSVKNPTGYYIIQSLPSGLDFWEAPTPLGRRPSPPPAASDKCIEKQGQHLLTKRHLGPVGKQWLTSNLLKILEHGGTQPGHMADWRCFTRSHIFDGNLSPNVSERYFSRFCIKTSKYFQFPNLFLFPDTPKKTYNQSYTSLNPPMLLFFF